MEKEQPLSASSDLLFLGRECMQRFVEAVAREEPGSRAQVLLENNLGRFKIWAGSIGLFALSRSGIDFRFREDERAREVLSTVLGRLKRSLAPKVVDLVTTSGTGSKSADIMTQTGRSPILESLSTHSDDEISIKEDSLEDSSSDNTDVIDAHLVANSVSFKDLGDTIDLLYRFLKFAKGSTSGLSSKVAEFKNKKAGTALDDPDLEAFIRASIEREIPGSSPALRERLAVAALDRRWRFLYKQSHHQKLSQELENWSVRRNAQSIFESPDLIQPTERLRLEREQLPTIIEPQQRLQKKVNFHIPMSTTDASITQKLAIPAMPKSTALSIITQSAVTRRNQLDVPPAPKTPGSNLKELICPYCWTVLNRETFGPAGRSRWMSVSSHPPRFKKLRS
jgi:hypothetical protein